LTLTENATRVYALTLQLNQKSGILDIQGSCPALCQQLVQKIDQNLPIDIGLINTALEKVKVPIVLPSSIGLNQLQLNYGNGYVEAAGVILPKVQNDVLSQFVEREAGMPGLGALPCPKIPDASQGSCVSH
jgi:hypothetical protein